MGNHLLIWTIYFKPKDHPEGYCARAHKVIAGHSKAMDDLITADSFEELRERFSSQGLVCIGREPQDDPVIVESWV